MNEALVIRDTLEPTMMVSLHLCDFQRSSPLKPPDINKMNILSRTLLYW